MKYEGRHERYENEYYELTEAFKNVL